MAGVISIVSDSVPFLPNLIVDIFKTKGQIVSNNL